MTTPPTVMTTPDTFQIKLSTQQRRNFAACAKMCGLDLAAWIVQCADVKAADAIDAMQASQREARPSRKKQQPRLRAERPVTETPVRGVRNFPAKNPAQNPGIGSVSSKSTTSSGVGGSAPKKTAPVHRPFDASTGGPEQRDTGVS